MGKYYVYLTEVEYSQVMHSLIEYRNSLIWQGRYTDEVVDVLCKVGLAKKKKVKVKYI